MELNLGIPFQIFISDSDRLKKSTGIGWLLFITLDGSTRSSNTHKKKNISGPLRVRILLNLSYLERKMKANI